MTEIAKHGLRAVELDVTSAASIAACRESVGRLTSKLDVLVNNA